MPVSSQAFFMHRKEEAKRQYSYPFLLCLVRKILLRINGFTAKERTRQRRVPTDALMMIEKGQTNRSKSPL
jgi:hypothetical protein